MGRPPTRFALLMSPALFGRQPIGGQPPAAAHHPPPLLCRPPPRPSRHTDDERRYGSSRPGHAAALVGIGPPARGATERALARSSRPHGDRLCASRRQPPAVSNARPWRNRSWTVERRHCGSWPGPGWSSPPSGSNAARKAGDAGRTHLEPSIAETDRPCQVSCSAVDQSS